MKTLLLTLYLSAGTVLIGYAQWFPVYTHADEETKLALIGSDTLVATTLQGGRIHRTTDGGQSWSFFQTPYSAAGFYDICFVNASVGYACGGSSFGPDINIVIKTADAGNTWTTITANQFAGGTFNNISFLNEDTGFVSGEPNKFYKTTDGGQTFQPVSLSNDPWNYPIGIYDIYFKGDKCFVSIDSGTFDGWITASAIIMTEDLGNTWTTVYTGTPGQEINDIYFLNDAVGYAVGYNGNFLKTVDGGNTWIQSTIGATNELYTVCFVNENTGYLNKDGAVYATATGGNVWGTQELQPPAVVSDIVFAKNGKTGYLIGGHNIYKTDNGGGSIGTKITSVELNNKIKVFPNPATTILQLQYAHDIKVAAIRLVGLDGRLVKNYKPLSKIIDLVGIAQGNYFLLLDTNKGLVSKEVSVL